MSREWVDDAKPQPRRGKDTRDKRWVMRCDVIHPSGLRCKTESEPNRDVAALNLARFHEEGWFIARVHGDVCPACLASGYVPRAEPHPRYEAITPDLPTTEGERP